MPMIALYCGLKKLPRFFFQSNSVFPFSFNKQHLLRKSRSKAQAFRFRYRDDETLPSPMTVLILYALNIVISSLLTQLD